MNSLQEAYIEEAAKTLAEDIDFEVLTSMLIEGGWVKVVLHPMTAEYGMEVDHWCETNIKGNFMNRGLVWVFKDPKEATWFTLRWLNG